MIFWIDAQLPPALAPWLHSTHGIDAVAVRDLGLRDADDAVIFQRARAADAIIVSKDADFVELVSRHGPPPRLLWVTCGNSTNERLRGVFSVLLPVALERLKAGSPIVEIADL